MPAYSIYISSTYRDLEAERELLIRFLRQAQYTVVSMETYPPASSQNIRLKCMEDVSEANIYVCIIGDRYGTPAIDENGKELPYSYTEYEYDSAVESKRKRLIFFKTTPDIQPDEKLLAFKNKIKATSPSFYGSFNDYQMLPGIVLASIIAETDGFVKRNISVNERYYCDRDAQMARLLSQYTQQIKKEPVLFFFLSGHDYNSHESFVKRYKYEFAVKNRDQEPWEFSCNIGPVQSHDPAELVKRIKEEINLGLNGIIGKYGGQASAGDYYEVMRTRGISTLIINLLLRGENLKNRKFIDFYKKAFETFYADFTSNVEKEDPEAEIILFLQFRYMEAGRKPSQYFLIEDWPFLTERKLFLTNIINDDLEFWLEKREIEENPILRRSLVLTYFDHLNPAEKDGRKAKQQGYYMAQAQIGMDKIIDLYNKRIKTI